MQRQLYLGLLLVTMALAAAVCLRPSLGEELIRLAGLRGGPAAQDAGPAGFPAGANACAGGSCCPSQPLAPLGQSVPWPATLAGESVASDAQLGFPSSPPPYRSAAQPPGPPWRETGRWPPASPSRPEAQTRAADSGRATSTAPPPGSTYPVAGAGRRDSPPVAAPGRQQGPVGPPIAQAMPCQGTEVLARVGNDVILASEVMPAYHEIMARIPQKELAALPKGRLELERKSLLSRLLEGHVQTKLIYQDAKRTIPEERFPEIEKKIAEHFVKEELPKRIEKAGVASAAEFDEKLRAMGSSLERMKRGFLQQAMAQNWLLWQREKDPEVSHGEMLDYYQEHRADYETPARARWEEISVRIPRYSDGREAYAKLAQMGNQVKQGRSMAEVVGAQPKDGLECRGGVQGWVTQGSLDVSQTIEEGIFTLPVGRPSRIFREGNAYHIIQVLEREERQENLFAEDPEIQKEIREKLQQLRRDEQTEEYLARLKEQFPVWTVFDDDPQLAEFRRRVDSSRN